MADDILTRLSSKLMTSAQADAERDRYRQMQLKYGAERIALEQQLFGQHHGSHSGINYETLRRQKTKISDVGQRNKLLAQLDAARAKEVEGGVNYQSFKKRIRGGEFARNTEIMSGVQFGQEVLGEEGLGRLGDDQEIQDVLARYKTLSEEGLSAPESLAKREQAFQGIGRAQTQAEAQLQARLAQAGVRGGAAGAQFRDLAVQGLQQRANVERDIFLESESLKRENLGKFADALGQVKTFDLGQAAREKDIILSAGMGYAQMGQAERTAFLQANAAEKAAAAQAAAACFYGDTFIKMKNGTYKPIIDINVGDETSQGKVWGKSQHLIPLSALISYQGVKVCKYHPVRTDAGVWTLVGDAPDVEEIYDGEFNPGIYVYDLWTEESRIEIKGEKGDILFTDYEGTQEIGQMNKMLLDELNALEAYNDASVETVSSGEVQSKDDNV
jgi:hypothetical protein